MQIKIIFRAQSTMVQAQSQGDQFIFIHFNLGTLFKSFELNMFDNILKNILSVKLFKINILFYRFSSLPVNIFFSVNSKRKN